MGDHVALDGLCRETMLRARHANPAPGVRSPSPDGLAAEARRWLCQVGYSTDPELIYRVIEALGRYYADTAVLWAIVHARRGPLLVSRRESYRAARSGRQ